MYAVDVYSSEDWGGGPVEETEYIFTDFASAHEHALWRLAGYPAEISGAYIIPNTDNDDGDRDMYLTTFMWPLGTLEHDKVPDN